MKSRHRSSRSPFIGPFAALSLAFGLISAGCADDIAPGGEEDDGGGDEAGQLREDPNMIHIDHGDYTETRVDASDAEQWVFLDLAAGAQVTVNDPGSEPGWTLAFNRFNIMVNGGVSGPGEVEVAFVADQKLEDTERAPEAGWRTDVPDGEEGESGLAFAEWYDYDPSTHVLTPKAGVYVVRDGTGAYALEILAYYNDAGTSGHPSFLWKAVQP